MPNDNNPLVSIFKQFIKKALSTTPSISFLHLNKRYAEAAHSPSEAAPEIYTSEGMVLCGKISDSVMQEIMFTAIPITAATTGAEVLPLE